MTSDKRRLSRRGFLKGGAAASLGTVAAGAVAAGTAQAQQAAPTPPHGAELRGMNLPVTDPLAEGRFGFMFKAQPEFNVDQSLLIALGEQMEERPRISKDTAWDRKLNATVTATKDHNDAFNENPNVAMTSGVTFIGQFVDHDITFDTTLLDDALKDPDATSNFRTPRYDLDAMYGRGPTLDPQFYESSDRAKLKVVRTKIDKITDTNGVQYTLATPEWLLDVPRNTNGTAIIADKRNDQHLIIAQLHVAFMELHNKLVDYTRRMRVPAAAVFESARRLTRWYYQWMVIHDFLPRIVGPKMASAVYEEVAGKPPVITMNHYRPTNSKDRAFIPVEFSVAAYRFGHSITRPRYTVRDMVTNQIVDGKNVVRAVSSVPLFEPTPSENNLNGGRKVPARLKMQWSKFFNDPALSALTARPTRQFDAKLSGPLFSLPSNTLPDTNPLELLAVRNLLRGKKMRLPSGQRLAEQMGVPVNERLTREQLWQRHVVEVSIPIASSNRPEILAEYDEEDAGLKAIFDNPPWNGDAPLWFYILKEAEIIGKGRELGPVGGRIVAEVLVGLLQRDLNSYLYLNPGWKPAAPITTTAGQCGIVDILRYAGVWS